MSFQNEEDWTSYKKHYTPSVKIKGFNVLIDGKGLFDVPIKNKEETYEKNLEMSKTNDYTTGNLLDCDYFSNHYKLNGVDLSKQIELENPDLKQQINFIGKLGEDDGATVFFIIKILDETTFEFSQNSVNII